MLAVLTFGYLGNGGFNLERFGEGIRGYVVSSHVGSLEGGEKVMGSRVEFDQACVESSKHPRRLAN